MMMIEIARRIQQRSRRWQGAIGTRGAAQGASHGARHLHGGAEQFGRRCQVLQPADGTAAQLSEQNLRLLLRTQSRKGGAAQRFDVHAGHVVVVGGRRHGSAGSSRQRTGIGSFRTSRTSPAANFQPLRCSHRLRRCCCSPSPSSCQPTPSRRRRPIESISHLTIPDVRLSYANTLLPAAGTSGTHLRLC